ncbi:MAG: hypothetical protein IRZ13_16335 [Acetobacteraceae bacterium]|nr:hypothetical protein [Acetobacteraceae bacterium]
MTAASESAAGQARAGPAPPRCSPRRRPATPRKQVILAGGLPKNTAGKLLKRELRARYSGTADAALGHA